MPTHGRVSREFVGGVRRATTLDLRRRRRGRPRKSVMGSDLSEVFEDGTWQRSVRVPRTRAGWNVPRIVAVTIPRDTRGGKRPSVPVPERGPSDTTAIGSRDAGGAAKAGLRRRSFFRAQPLHWRCNGGGARRMPGREDQSAGQMEKQFDWRVQISQRCQVRWAGRAYLNKQSAGA